MRTIDNLEIHVAHGCNLACESCSHYSNQGHKGILDLHQAVAWMKLWNTRLSPKTFSLVGGEPAIHPRLAEFVSLSRVLWPQAHLRLVSNGLLLDRHPDLPRALRDPNASLHISVHHGSAEYQERLKPIFDLLESWKARYGIHVVLIESYKNWTRRYKGVGAAMEPYDDGQPRSSWEHCTARFCAQLHEGKIWKCGPLAYLGLQDAKYGLSEKWKPYLAYQPLEATCTDKELNAFFNREDEFFCRMCSAKPERFELPMPLPSRRVPLTAVA